MAFRVGLLLLVSSVCAFAPSNALAQPEGRVYEMVSPTYKGGYAADPIEAVANDGESVVFFSQGAFAGAPGGPRPTDYLARRDRAGWSTAPLMPPASILPSNNDSDVSESLELVMFVGKSGPNEGVAAQEGTEDEFLVHETGLPDIAANWETAGFALKAVDERPYTLLYVGASQNFCHILFDLGEANLLPEAENTHSNLYELDTGCGVPAALRLVGVEGNGENIKVISPACVLNQVGGPDNHFNAIAADGEEIFFTQGVGNGCPGALFVRVGGTKTLQVSPVSEVEAAPVVFQGGSEDGSKVFFTDGKSVVGADKTVENELYLARIGCPSGEGEACIPSETESTAVSSTTSVSRGANPGEAGEVQGVVRVSQDGTRVYFVAHGVLSGTPNASGELASRGADNLYVYDDSTPGATPVFITDLCSGPGLSGVVKEARCPLSVSATPGSSNNDTNLWLGGGGEAQATRDGEFLVFSSFGQLVSSDTDTTKDVYRYDAATGELERVSLGEDGAEADGNSELGEAGIAAGKLGGFVATQYEMGNRAISEDGTRIVFHSNQRLSEKAINGLVNAYEWHKEPDWGEGVVSLVSTGSDEAPVNDVVISPGGGDVFFVTTQGLVPQDTDGAQDIYDARLGGGFPSQSASPQPCSGDACQGPLTNPAPLLVPGSVSQAAGENLSPPKKKAAAKKKLTKRAKKPKARAKKATGRSRKKAKGKKGGLGSNGKRAQLALRSDGR
jgi:hypothetical protein